MNGFEVIYRLLSDETDRAAIFAALPTVEADINMVADDIIKIGKDIKTLNFRVMNLAKTVGKITG